MGIIVFTSAKNGIIKWWNSVRYAVGFKNYEKHPKKKISVLSIKSNLPFFKTILIVFLLYETPVESSVETAVEILLKVKIFRLLLSPIELFTFVACCG